MGVRVPRDSVGVSPVDPFVPHENPEPMAIEDALFLAHHLPAVFSAGVPGRPADSQYINLCTVHEPLLCGYIMSTGRGYIIY